LNPLESSSSCFSACHLPSEKNSSVAVDWDCCLNSQSESWANVHNWSEVTEIHVKRQVVELGMNFEVIPR